ncbi:MAG: hypothetical protein JXN64_09720 [Spirochaetes bacterium]|nr:hypothetical protein [Spirochaetota bacterium]
MNKNITKLFLAFIIAILPAAIHAKTIAFVGAQNLSGNSAYDYLGAYIEGVILFDISNVKDITIVERSRLEKIISEQQLLAAGLTAEGREKQSIHIGRLLAADYLVSVDYTMVGSEASFTLRLADTATGAVRVFSSRGSTENDIHSLAEGLAKALSGKDHVFVNKAEKRNLLTLRDMTPGSVTLYCNLVNAEILLDGKFAAYSKGNLYAPLQIPDIDPGTYTMKIRLSNDFGMVKLPEFTFSDWEEKITIKPGRATVLRSVIRHFNDVIYEHSRLLDGDYQLTDKNSKIRTEKDVSFIDRTGKTIPVKFTLSGTRTGSGSTAECVLQYEGQKHILKISKESPEVKKKIGKIKIEFKLDTSGSQKDKISLDITRTDIRQGMHRE